MSKTKKVHPLVSKVMSENGKKGWAARRRQIIEAGKEKLLSQKNDDTSKQKK